MTFRNFVRGNPDLSLWIVVPRNSTIRASYQWKWIDVCVQNLRDLVIWAQRNKLDTFLRCEQNSIKLPRRDSKHQLLYTVNSRCQSSHEARNLMTEYMITFCQVRDLAILVRGKGNVRVWGNGGMLITNGKRRTSKKPSLMASPAPLVS